MRNPYPPPSSPRPTLRQTTIPETIGRAPHPDRPVPIDTSTHTQGNDWQFGASHPATGGSVISPRHRDRDLRARHLGASRYDVLKLACSEYHMGMDGVPLLMEDILDVRGFSQVTGNIDDVVMCYNDIILPVAANEAA